MALDHRPELSGGTENVENDKKWADKIIKGLVGETGVNIIWMSFAPFPWVVFMENMVK